jgi:hypothetical protein
MKPKRKLRWFVSVLANARPHSIDADIQKMRTVYATTATEALKMVMNMVKPWGQKTFARDVYQIRVDFRPLSRRDK